MIIAVDIVQINPGEPGFYWVVVDEKWQVAAWDGDMWNFITLPGCHKFSGIGNRIPEPIEPPRYGEGPK